MSDTSNNQSDTGRRLASGVAGLDEVLGGGWPANRLNLVLGAPGTGKTTLALQFLLAGARRGEPVLYVTLSETRDELRAVARSHGWDLENIPVYELTPPEESLRPEQQYTILHPGEVEFGETIWAVLEEVERTRPERVVFDSLAELRLLARDQLRYRRQILGLKQFFAGRHCTVLLLDSHDAGDANVESLAHSVVHLEQLAPDYGSERRRLRVVKLRGSSYRGGYHDFAIRTGGTVVFPRVVSADQQASFAPEAVSSDVPELDHLLNGGFDRGTSALLMGPAGVGKSVLASQYALAAANRGERAVLYLFDESIVTFLTRSAGLGLDIQPHVASGRIELRQLAPAELSTGEFAQLVRVAAENGASVVVIDSLNGYLNAMAEERAVILHLHELLGFLGQCRVLTLMTVAQHGLVGPTETPIDVSYLADSVVLLRYFEAAGELRQAISVVKKRSGGHERAIRELRLGPGLRLGPPLKNFQGVLTGIPTYVGDEGALINGNHGGG